MPLTTDTATLDLSEKVIGSLHKVFGEHPGFRAAHAKGALVTGTFTPTPAAAGLSTAPHFNKASTPVTARFSSSTGIPQLPDSDPNGDPRGFALRFDLGPHKHTDIIAHSTNAFPVRTGEEFLAFFQAIAAAGAGGPPITDFIAARPAVARFATTPKPMPTSLATEAYFGLVAVKFISASGTQRYGRYDFVPVAGVSHVSDEVRQSRSANYLYDEIRERIQKAPVELQVWVQLANDGDVTDDVTIAWPGKSTCVAYHDHTLITLQRIARGCCLVLSLSMALSQTTNNRRRRSFLTQPRVSRALNLRETHCTRFATMSTCWTVSAAAPLHRQIKLYGTNNRSLGSGLEIVCFPTISSRLLFRIFAIFSSDPLATSSFYINI